MKAEPFPTGRAAHRKCTECGATGHVYMFPLDRVTGERGPVCMSCTEARATAERLARLTRR